jgi:hypothetical protein
MKLRKGDGKLIISLVATIVAIILIVRAVVSALTNKMNCEEKGGFQTRAGCVRNGEIIGP